ncbi:MAG TPA: homoserine kinase [Pyrinomonadaceae bacterium]|nr:homoserine kinase [Pyrinomonadaceae bacterium]
MAIATEPAGETRVGARAVEVRVPASTSNLGPGFDCFGLAFQLYLTIRATRIARSRVSCRVRTIGPKENAKLPRTSENLIFRAMKYVANREGEQLPSVYLAAHNEIPISRGLGGSAAAIVGGIKLFTLLTNKQIPENRLLQYATEFEGHPDNVAAALLGGFVVTCVGPLGNVIAVKRSWPPELKIVVVSPDTRVETRLARAALPRVVNHTDAVYNLQRSALFNAALSERRFDLVWEATRDRLHQQRRQSLVPGLAEALSLPKMPGLIGLALSGAGPSVLAIVEDHSESISQTIANCFQQHGIKTSIRRLEVDTDGCRSRVLRTE